MTLRPHSFPTRQDGSRSYAGYEYQISVTVWVALDLMLAKELTDSLTIEPPSQEDIEAALIAPEQASLDIVCDAGAQLCIQIKTRSRSPWTGPALADVLKGSGKRPDSRTRASPLATLAAHAQRRYVFITNEGLHEALRPYAGDHLFDRHGTEILPPHTRSGIDGATQRSVAPRLLLLGGITIEVLQARVSQLLARFGHVPSVRHAACISDLEVAVRQRLTGYAGGCWTRAEVLEILFRNGGSAAPTRTMDHYVAPQSYAAIRRSLDERHVVIIAGPSGIGKTLTADIIELALRRADPPYDVIGEEQGPGYVRTQLMTHNQPVLFHLRDPWGRNRLKSGADRWSNELPKLLRDAGPGRKFLITSRSDVLQSAGDALQSELMRYVVAIDVEHYGPDRLAQIYDRMSTGLSGPTLHLATAYRDLALQTLSRPYEIDRFLVALTQKGTARQSDIERLLEESQVDAISRIVAQQIASLDRDGVAGATIIWALLSARGAVAADVFPILRRRLRALDPNLRVDLDGLVDFLVAGRNLRREHNALAFHHPRVEDGLRRGILSHRAEAEHVLSKVADVLTAWDAPGEDWGVETLRNMLLALDKLESIQLTLAERTHARLDTFLETTAIGTDDPLDVLQAFEHLQQHGSAAHVPCRLARLLMDSENDPSGYGRRWRTPSLSTAEVALLKQHARVQPLFDRFIRDVLAFRPIRYDHTFVPFVSQFGFDLTESFAGALEETLSGIRHPINIDVVVAGVLSGDSPNFDGLIELIVQHRSVLDAWLAAGYETSARMAAEYELNAELAEDVLNAPAYRYQGVETAMMAVVQLRRASQGVAWIQGHPHRQLVISALSTLFADAHAAPLLDELLCLLEYAEGSAREDAWRAASQHWRSDLNALLEQELLKPELHSPDLLQQLVDNAVVAAQVEETECVSMMLARVAASSSVERRLQLVYHLMGARVYGIRSESDETAAAFLRVVRLAETFPAPQDELARALCAVLGGNDIGTVGKNLSAPAVQLLSTTLPRLPASVAGTAVCLAAAAGVDPLATAEHLLTTDSAEDGEAAVRALLLHGTPQAIVAVKRASIHGRSHVRCLVLRALVERAVATDRVALTSAADDRSAEVRREWADLMGTHLWPEAVDSLVRLLKDEHDFCAHHVHPGPDSWIQYAVARRAARALGSYEDLPGSAIDALLEAAAATASEDPFVACTALSALAGRDDLRIPAVLHAVLFSPGFRQDPACRPVAEVASWSILDRVLTGRPILTDTRLFETAYKSRSEISCPLLMAYGALGGNEREVLLSKLVALGLQDHADLVLLAAAMTGQRTADNTSVPCFLLAKLAAGETFNPAQREEIEAWSRSLNPEDAVQQYAVWIASKFNLPVQAHSRLPPSDEQWCRTIDNGD
jgi:hypothetical protein